MPVCGPSMSHMRRTKKDNVNEVFLWEALVGRRDDAVCRKRESSRIVTMSTTIKSLCSLSAKLTNAALHDQGIIMLANVT